MSAKPFQIGRVVLTPDAKKGTVSLKILHEDLGREAVLTLKEFAALIETGCGVLEDLS